jgi:hypothetical protein
MNVNSGILIAPLAGFFARLPTWRLLDAAQVLNLTQRQRGIGARRETMRQARTEAIGGKRRMTLRLLHVASLPSFPFVDFSTAPSVPLCLCVRPLRPLECALLSRASAPDAASPPGWCSDDFRCRFVHRARAVHPMHKMHNRSCLFFSRTAICQTTCRHFSLPGKNSLHTHNRRSSSFILLPSSFHNNLFTLITQQALRPPPGHCSPSSDSHGHPSSPVT